MSDFTIQIWCLRKPFQGDTFPQLEWPLATGVTELLSGLDFLHFSHHFFAAASAPASATLSVFLCLLWVKAGFPEQEGSPHSTTSSRHACKHKLQYIRPRKRISIAEPAIDEGYRVVLFTLSASHFLTQCCFCSKKDSLFLSPHTPSRLPGLRRVNQPKLGAVFTTTRHFISSSPFCLFCHSAVSDPKNYPLLSLTQPS